MKKITVILMASLFMFACNTARKATKQIAKIQLSYPELLADFCHVNYPPIIKQTGADTSAPPTTSLQHVIDSLTNQVTTYKQTAKEAENRADKAIWQSYQNKDTACAALLIDMKKTISNLRDQNDNLVSTLSKVQAAYNDLKAHPQYITKTVVVSDSAKLYLLTTERDNAINQLAGKDGEIKQLSKLNKNKNIAIAVMGIIIAGGVFLKFKS